MITCCYNQMNVKTQIRLENIKIEAIKARIVVFKNMAVTKRLPWQCQICWTQDTNVKLFLVKF